MWSIRSRGPQSLESKCLMVWGGADVIIIEIQCIINVMHLNHPQIMPTVLSPWGNCLPRNWFLVPKRLGTTGRTEDEEGSPWTVGLRHGLNEPFTPAGSSYPHSSPVGWCSQWPFHRQRNSDPGNLGSYPVSYPVKFWLACRKYLKFWGKNYSLIIKSHKCQ